MILMPYGEGAGFLSVPGVFWAVKRKCLSRLGGRLAGMALVRWRRARVSD